MPAYFVTMLSDSMPSHRSRFIPGCICIINLSSLYRFSSDMLLLYVATMRYVNLFVSQKYACINGSFTARTGLLSGATSLIGNVRPMQLVPSQQVFALPTCQKPPLQLLVLPVLVPCASSPPIILVDIPCQSLRDQVVAGNRRFHRI